jgi:hypothetical protein
MRSLFPGFTQSYKKYQLTVVFTKEDETADSYIERIAGELNDRLTQVTVATSDLAEQWTIFSQGALRTSARELYKTVQQTEDLITGDTKDTHFKNFRRNSPWNNEQLQKLSHKLDELSNKKINYPFTLQSPLLNVYALTYQKGEKEMEVQGFEKTFIQYLPIVYKMQSRYLIKGFDSDDWLQEGRSR